MSAVAIGQLGLPRRYVTVMYACWALGVALLAGYGLMTTLWQGMLIGLLTASLFEVGQIIWVTLLQTEVPRDLLGRISSLDWLVSTGLVPVSFALTGPVAGAIGPQNTIIAAGAGGGGADGHAPLLPWRARSRTPPRRAIRRHRWREP